ncbi:hypothetical protein CRENBAI_020870 [Crenichthys baileyi]|uniref:Uncharacterized protein n=1 Tax=Crenichthys baileyi TaxID=28760 RepID=A0AAV9S3G3_9TELE
MAGGSGRREGWRQETEEAGNCQLDLSPDESQNNQVHCLGELIHNGEDGVETILRQETRNEVKHDMGPGTFQDQGGAEKIPCSLGGGLCLSTDITGKNKLRRLDSWRPPKGMIEEWVLLRLGHPESGEE